MGRPRGVPTTRKEFRLEDKQLEQLEALRAVAPYGEPSLVSLVRQAIDEFISKALANVDTHARVERYLRTHQRVASLHVRRVK